MLYSYGDGYSRRVQIDPVSKPGSRSGLKTLLLVTLPPATPAGIVTADRVQPARIRWYDQPVLRAATIVEPVQGRALSFGPFSVPPRVLGVVALLDRPALPR